MLSILSKLPAKVICANFALWLPLKMHWLKTVVRNGYEVQVQECKPR